MSLIVVGESIDHTLPLAAIAALTSGEAVSFTGGDGHGEHKVEVEGAGFAGSATIISVTSDTPITADRIVVAAPAKDHAALFARQPENFAGKMVLLAPGGFAGALINAKRFRDLGLVEPRFSEVSGWIAGGNLDGQKARITMRKRNVGLAAPSDQDTTAALEVFYEYFPDLVSTDLLNTSLSNINAIIHPPLAILNATRIENGEAWCYWDEGFTPAVHSLMGAVDQERVAVIEALGGTAMTLLDMAMASYRDAGLRGDNFYDAVKDFSLYRHRRGPVSLESRFLTDDVPNGVAAYEQIAQAIGLPHPTLTAVRAMSEVILGRELKADGDAVSALVAYARARKAEARPADFASA